MEAANRSLLRLSDVQLGPWAKCGRQGPEVASPVDLSHHAAIILDLFHMDDEEAGDRGLACTEGSHDKALISGITGHDPRPLDLEPKLSSTTARRGWRWAGPVASKP